VIARQIVWLSEEATDFAAPCEACLADCRRELGFIVGRRVCRIEGRLGRSADVGFMTCRRGHRILIRRAASRPAARVR
jgi:hypothetical protein